MSGYYSLFNLFFFFFDVYSLLFLLCIFFLFEFQNGILYRGVSPDVLMLDQTGYLQVGAVPMFFAALYSSISIFIFGNNQYLIEVM